MVYQDHLTKFVMLKPQRSKTAGEVASNLLSVFSTIGAPTILQSDNGREFANQVVTELCSLWSGLKIVHGKPRHSQSQGSVERANRDIEHMLGTWMAENNTRDWVKGLSIVQLMKNSAFHSGIRRSPYSALFGSEMRMGLTSTSLPKAICEKLRTEEDLEEILESYDPSSQIEEVLTAEDFTSQNSISVTPQKVTLANNAITHITPRRTISANHAVLSMTPFSTVQPRGPAAVPVATQLITPSQSSVKTYATLKTVKCLIYGKHLIFTFYAHSTQ